MGLFSSIGKVIGKVTDVLSPTLPFVQAGLDYFGAQQQNQVNSARILQQQQYNADQAGIQRQWSGDQAVLARRASAKQTRDNWMRGMTASSTQYQRGMKDMRAAGLNPILAFKQGGASSPTSSGPSFGTPSSAAATAGTIPAVNELGGRVASALSAKQAMANIEQTNALTTQARQQTQLITENTATAKAQARVKKSEARKVEDYGSSWFGGLVNTIEKMIKRGYSSADAIRKALRKYINAADNYGSKKSLQVHMKNPRIEK